MTAAAEAVIRMDAAAYHAHPALSSTQARWILDCPAKYRWRIDNPPDPTVTMHFGSAAHRLVLGEGPDYVTVDAPDWRTADARRQREEANAAGAPAILAHEMTVIRDMAAALWSHPTAGRLLARPGTSEAVLLWSDPDNGVHCRAMLDRLPGLNPPATRSIITDYKTTRDASPRGFARAVATYGYHVQAAWYLDAVAANGLGVDAVFVFIAQEKDPPYLVGVYQLDQEDLALGHRMAAKSRRVYRDCTLSGTWPGYALEPVTLRLPYWATYEEETP